MPVPRAFTEACGDREPTLGRRAPGGGFGHAAEPPMDGVLQDGRQHEGAEPHDAGPEQVQHQEGSHPGRFG